MKKIISAILCIAMLFLLSACAATEKLNYSAGDIKHGDSSSGNIGFDDSGVIVIIHRPQIKRLAGVTEVRFDGRETRTTEYRVEWEENSCRVIRVGDESAEESEWDSLTYDPQTETVKRDRYGTTWKFDEFGRIITWDGWSITYDDDGVPTMTDTEGENESPYKFRLGSEPDTVVWDITWGGENHCYDLKLDKFGNFVGVETAQGDSRMTISAETDAGGNYTKIVRKLESLSDGEWQIKDKYECTFTYGDEASTHSWERLAQHIVTEVLNDDDAVYPLLWQVNLCDSSFEASQILIVSETE